MDDSEVAVMYPSKEINGNLTPPSESNLGSPVGEDEVDSPRISPRIFLPPVLDEMDSSSRSIVASTADIIDKDSGGKHRNDNDDDGYYSQDQMQPIGNMLQSPGVSYCRSHRDSILNNNLANLSHMSPSLQDATGKVLSVSMPPSYIVRSNEQRTTFRPNLNEISSINSHDDDAGVYVAELPSRHALVDNRTEGVVSPQRTLPCSNARHAERGGRQSEPARGLDNHESAAINAPRRSSVRPGPAAVEAGTNRSPPNRKRKGRDDEDGNDGMKQGPSEPDTKRMRGEDIAQRHPFQGKKSFSHPCMVTQVLF